MSVMAVILTNNKVLVEAGKPVSEPKHGINQII